MDRAYRFHDRRVARALSSLADEVDVVHAWPKAASRTFAAARSLGIPCLREVPNTPHGLRIRRRRPRGVEARRRRGRRPLAHVRPAGARAGGAGVRARRRPAGPVRVRPTDVRRPRRSGREARPARYGFDEARFPAPTAESGAIRPRAEALFVGSCEPRKGLHYALQAWLASGAAETGRFVVCGRFVPGYREAVEQWLRASERRRARLRRRPRRADARERRLRVPLGRGGKRARDLRGAGVGLRARRLGRDRRPGRCSGAGSCSRAGTWRR